MTDAPPPSGPSTPSEGDLLDDSHDAEKPVFVANSKWWLDPQFGFDLERAQKAHGGPGKRTIRVELRLRECEHAALAHYAAAFGAQIGEVLRALSMGTALRPRPPKALKRPPTEQEREIKWLLRRLGQLQNQLATDAAIIRAKIQRGESAPSLEIIARLCSDQQLIREECRRAIVQLLGLEIKNPQEGST